MAQDFADLTEQEAMVKVMELLRHLSMARETADAAQRRIGGVRKMIDGYVEMFPALEDMLPDDLDVEAPRPRGAAAALSVLTDNPKIWMTVARVVDALGERGWLPDSSNPANAVRSALERLVDAEIAEKGNLRSGAVAYHRKPAEAKGVAAGGGYDDFGEEPF